MPSEMYIRSQLVNFTNADDSESEAKNNRIHYSLSFDESIGWDWIETQVYKCSSKVGLPLEPYKLRPGDESFTVEVREVERREAIDESQHGLSEYER